MKILFICLAAVLHSPAFSQCANNMASRSYDTVLTGIGYGTYKISFPKWNSDSGLLASVTIRSRVTVHYGFTLKNVDVVPSTYSLWVGRVEAFSSPLMRAPYNNVREQSIGVFPLNNGEKLVKDPFLFLDNYSSTDSITGTQPFLGSDSVRLTYSPSTYTTLHTDNNASYSYGAAVRDTVHFSITYLYCKGEIILAAGLTRFTALPEGPSSVRIGWSAANEAEGRQYEIQRSRDGLSFTTAAQLPAGESDGSGTATGGTADYTYEDRLPAAGSEGKWYYRLRIQDPGGSLYSAVKMVTIGTAGRSNRGLSVYPNPAENYVDLAFDQGNGAGWRVELMTADGRCIQSDNYLVPNNVQVYFRRNYASGTYFLRATAIEGGRSFVQRIIKR